MFTLTLLKGIVHLDGSRNEGFPESFCCAGQGDEPVTAAAPLTCESPVSRVFGVTHDGLQLTPHHLS